MLSRTIAGNDAAVFQFVNRRYLREVVTHRVAEGNACNILNRSEFLQILNCKLFCCFTGHLEPFPVVCSKTERGCPVINPNVHGNYIWRKS